MSPCQETWPPEYSSSLRISLVVTNPEFHISGGWNFDEGIQQNEENEILASYIWLQKEGYTSMQYTCCVNWECTQVINTSFLSKKTAKVYPKDEYESR